MERFFRLKESHGRVDFPATYDLERQLATAERRYAEARGSCDKARQDLRALTSQSGAAPSDVSSANARFDALAARCVRLRNLIDDLEKRLDE